MFWAIISLFYAIQAIAAGSDYRAGVANLDISPSEQVLIAGPAGELRIRTGAPSGLGVHALALEDRSGARFVIVSADLSGLSRSVADPVAAEALKRYGLDRASLLLSCSPAPAGPVLRGPALELFDLNPGDMEAAARYTRKVVEDLVSVIGAALAHGALGDDRNEGQRILRLHHQPSPDQLARQLRLFGIAIDLDGS